MLVTRYLQEDSVPGASNSGLVLVLTKIRRIPVDLTEHPPTPNPCMETESDSLFPTLESAPRTFDLYTLHITYILCSCSILVCSSLLLVHFHRTATRLLIALCSC